MQSPQKKEKRKKKKKKKEKTVLQMDGQTDKLAGRQKCKQTDEPTDKHMDKR